MEKGRKVEKYHGIMEMHERRRQGGTSVPTLYDMRGLGLGGEYGTIRLVLLE